MPSHSEKIQSEKNYWKEQWKKQYLYVCSEKPDFGNKYRQAWTTILVLAEYAQFFRDFSKDYDGKYSSIGCFFSGNWNRHHASAVEKAIGGFFQPDHSDCSYAATPKLTKVTEKKELLDVITSLSTSPQEKNIVTIPPQQTVEYVLAKIKNEIGNKPINPNGTLAAILKVIEEKTGVNYDALVAQDVINDSMQKKGELVDLSLLGVDNELDDCNTLVGMYRAPGKTV